jgi:hypothetical protein
LGAINNYQKQSKIAIFLLTKNFFPAIVSTMAAQKTAKNSGRPPVKELQDKPVYLRFTPTDFSRLEKWASAKRLPLTLMVRRVVLEWLDRQK